MKAHLCFQFYIILIIMHVIVKNNDFQQLNIFQPYLLQTIIQQLSQTIQLIIQMKLKTSSSNYKMTSQSPNTHIRTISSEQETKRYLKDFIKRTDTHPTPHISRLQLNKQRPNTDRVMMSRQEDLIKLRYIEIEQVLNQQNRNLKKQAQYLATQVRKTMKKQKLQRQECAKMKEEFSFIVRENQTLQKQNTKIQSYVKSKVMLLINCIKSTHQQMIEEVSGVIRQLCQYFNISWQPKDVVIPREDKYATPIIQNQNQQINNDQYIFRNKVEDLNDKFQALMYEYRNSNKPQIRKECIKIAKEIKDLKVQRNNSLTTKTKQPTKTTATSNIYPIQKLAREYVSSQEIKTHRINSSIYKQLEEKPIDDESNSKYPWQQSLRPKSRKRRSVNDKNLNSYWHTIGLK